MAWTTANLRRGLVGAWLGALGCGDDASGADSRGTDTASGSATLTTTNTTLTGSPTTDPDSSTSDPTTSTSSADASTGSVACPDSHACVAVPSGWTGPVLLRGSNDPRETPSCPAEYPELVEAGGSKLVAPAADCSCSCGEPNGAGCALATTLHYWGTDPTCSVGSPVESYNVFTTVCNDLNDVIPANSYFQVDPVVVDGGSCVPGHTMTLEPASFGKSTSTCGGAQLLEGCSAQDEVCAPRAGADALCVWQDGDSDCPEGYDADRTLVHRSIDDTRGCDDCTCTDPLGLCDGASITMFANVCNPPISGLLDATGECDLASAASVTRSAIFAVGEPNAFCVASDPVATGVATPAEPVTVCCAG